MKTSRCSVRVAVFVMVLTALVFSPWIAAAQEIGIVEGSVTSEPYGTFNGIAYVKYEGRFVGLADGEYDVPFEIIAPEDPNQGNGIAIVEPFHPLGDAGALKGYLTPEFLLERGFSHAGIGYREDAADPMAWYLEDDPIEILNNYALCLREDDAARDMVGDLDWLYGVGVSRVTVPLLALLASEGTAVLDFSFLFVPSWEVGTYTQHPSSNNIMVFLTEWDLVDSARWGLNTDALRGSSETYRSYEVAGGPHVPDIQWVRKICMETYGITSEGTTPLDWSPAARALFLAGHRWTTEGIEPPPSAYLAEAQEGEIDPVYQAEYELELETGIARDENGNALGGIRLPDLEIGRGQYIALDPLSFFGFGLFGTWEDLQCESLDGRDRFRNHGKYVSQFVRQTRELVREGFLLEEDAERMIEGAAESDVGKPHSCSP